MTPRQSELITELERGLRAAHELNQFLQDTVDADEDSIVQISAHDTHCASLIALMNDSREAVARALETLEMVQSGVLIRHLP